MPPTLRKPARAAAAAVLLLGTAVFAGAQSRVTLRGHVTRRVLSSTKLGPAPADEKVELSLVVNIDQGLLQQTLNQLYGQGAPKNKHFLTSAEFAQKFDFATQRQALKDFARASGLTVGAKDWPYSQVVHVSGTAGLVKKAFGVNLYHYRARNGQVFTANDADPSIPASLVPHLRAVIGLSNYHGAMRSHLRRFNPKLARARPSASGAAPRNVLSGTGPSCYNGQCGLAPADIKTIYGLTGGALNGSGQKIALLELDSYAASDITLYEDGLFSSPYPGTAVDCYSIDSPAASPYTWCGECGADQNQSCDSTTLASDDGMIEVALDIDMAIALSSGAAQIMVYTTYNGANSYILDAYGKIASDDEASVASSSWGEDEIDATASLMNSENTIFEQMAAQGQSMFAAAGDGGAYDAAGEENASQTAYEAWDDEMLTDDPASQPYVTGVGGTGLTSSNGAPNGTVTEQVWNNGCINPAGTEIVSDTCSTTELTEGYSYSAGGGGIANYDAGGSPPVIYWPLPSYQSGVSTVYSSTYRNVPDVALNADPDASPYNICVGGTCNDTTNYTTLIGGTSAASPLWAAFTALADQKLASAGGSPVGFANPALYSLAGGSSYASLFNDIKSSELDGNNGYYAPGTGYDNASGWGSFKGNALIAALAGTAPDVASASGQGHGVSSITWTWSAAAGATGYDLYYATSPATLIAALSFPTTTYALTGLSANTTMQIVIKSTDAAGVSAGTASSEASTFAQPPTGASVIAATSSFAVSYTPCPTSPLSASCEGFELDASKSSTFSSGVVYSSTTDGQHGSLTVSGLATTTVYYLRLATLDALGDKNYVYLGQFTTAVNLVAPSTPTFGSVTTSGIVFEWSEGSNTSGLQYLAQESSASVGGTLTGTVNAVETSPNVYSANFSGLSPDTSYYFRVQAVGGPFTAVSTQATSVNEPTAAAAPFSAVGATTLAVNWSNNGDPVGALYEADLSLSASFSTLASSQSVSTTTAVFVGLSSNTPYYARTRAFSLGGTPTAYLTLGSTTTLALAPSLASPPFTAVSTGSLTAAVNSSGNPAGTTYVFQLSTSPAFVTLTASRSGTATTVGFGGLWSNATYYVQVAALNSTGGETAFSTSEWTVTFVAAPGTGAAPSGASATALNVAWTASGFGPGTQFQPQVSPNSTFSPLTPGTATTGTSGMVGGLSANTTYYAEVQALAQSGSTNPNGAFTNLGAGSTLASPVVSASFSGVGVSSLSVTWPATAGNEGFRVDVSTSASFASLTVSSSVAVGAMSATLGGLFYDTTYYARVGTLNSQDAANEYALAASTVTGAPTLSTGVVASGTLVLSLPLAAPLVSLTVTIPAGAFPAGTVASAIAGFFGTPLTTLVGASSSEAPIAPLGAQAAFCVSGADTCLYSGGPQPAQPVVFSVAYDAGGLPAGYAENSIQLFRYDPTVGQWTIVPSQDDATTHTLTAYTSHFTLFAPFFATPANPGDLSPVQIFPQPWEESGSSSYYATVLTFASLPAGADVKVFTLAGELIWEGSASGSGVVTWGGQNKSGRTVASGTYLVVIESSGAKRLRRVVLIR